MSVNRYLLFRCISAFFKLYFYSRNDPSHRENHMEVDFLITRGKKICPIEVKSGNYRSHSSIDKFQQKFSQNIGEE